MSDPERPAGSRPTHRRATTWRITLAAATAAATTAALLGFTGSASAAVLFTDDFEDGNATGWSTSGGSWSVVSDGSSVYRQTSTSADAKSLAGQAAWTDYSVEALVVPIAFNGSNRSLGVAARVQSTSSFYSLVLSNAGRVELRRVSGGGVTALATAATPVVSGTARRLRLETSGTALRGYVDGVHLVSTTDTAFASGRVGLVASYASGSFDGVQVYTGGTQPSPSTSPSASASTSTSPPPPIPPGQADGFASVNALGRNGTTGGAGGTTVTVTTAEELRDYVGRAGPFVIRVAGSIALGSMATVVADKTIVGVGSSAQITSGGLQLGSTTRPGNNVIIRNLTFRGASDDSVSVTNAAHHVWIDHNEFFPAYDGSLDVKRQSTFVTVSWNVFHGTDKSMLLGHSDGYAGDIGFLKVTYHHNLFDGSNQRHPRARFGEPVHVYNNHYLNVGLYGVASTMNAGLVVEGNYFENVAFPCYSASGYADSEPGRLVQRANAFANSGTCEANGSVAEPGGWYAYTLDSAATVPARVSAGAGVGRIS
ncbi:pectate lyase [Allocatelliglobosispora scoriae]|uniref:Pectate lyase n=1 Tax=Allocatelliglobosispora scoriae TaxID=643052 RepID=A0A841C1D7_9ACTN|nr:pectate lyase [Allocatelliglobosispora scoriae]MBB5873558.1 pectate lyase [Allocatelliglobosispora scoriae]